MDDTSIPDRGPSVLAVTTTTLIIATVFVVARLFSRIFVVKNVSLDDYLMILAWILAFLISFLIDFGTTKGLGRYDANIKKGWVFDLKSSEYAFSVLYNPALMATKSSILIFYLRLSRNTKPLLRIASYITLAIVNTAGVVLTCLCIFQCRPISAAFAPNEGTTECISLVTLYLTSAPVNIITDLAILILPIPVLTSMRLPQKQKNILIVTFGLGAFVTIVDVVRIYYLQQASMDFLMGSVEENQLGYDANFSWYASLSLMWTAVEVNMGIICACIPTLKPLISKLRPHWIDHGMTRSEQLPTSHFQPTSTALHNRQQPSFDQDGNHDRQSNISEVNSLGHRSDFQSSIHTIEDEPSLDRRDSSTRDVELRVFIMEPQMRPSSRCDTLATTETVNSVYFGFVNMKRPKSILKTRGKETFQYCTLVTILFCLWGFSYGLLNVLNNEISAIARESVVQTLFLTGAYFGAYSLGPLLAYYLLKKGGFKATFIAGLCIYGIGILMWWPSAVLGAFPGFFISNLVVGFGLSILETAANPFLALCGPEQYSELRLLFAQGFQGVASVIAPLIAEKVFFRDVNKKLTLVDVQWAYLAIALLSVMLALFIYYMPLPEATDAELDESIQSDPPLNNPLSQLGSKFFGKYSVVLTTLVIGTTSQFLYVSAQQGISIFCPQFLQSITTTEITASIIPLANFSIIAQTLFTLSRFLFAGLTLVIPPRILLLISFVGTSVFSIAMVSVPVPNTMNTDTLATASLLVFFFEGPIFPLIFAISLRGLGRYTKAGAALLTASACGGGFSPFAVYAVRKKGSGSAQFILVVVLFALGTLYPVYLNFATKAKDQVDSKSSKRGREDSFELPWSKRRFSLNILGKK